MSRKKLGLGMSIALVAGTMIGSGIFLLPAALAPYGALSVGGWLFTSLGAVLLALTLGRLSRRLPYTGGPYAYAQAAFGPLAGFLMGWGYWISLLTGSAAVAVAMVGYLGVFWPWLLSNPLVSALTALAAIWLLIGINARGLQSFGKMQVVTTILKTLPIIMVILGGLLYFEPTYFEPAPTGGVTGLAAVTATATLTFWAFIGLEATAVSAESIVHPERNVPLSTMLGVLVVAALYIGGTVSVMGLLPNSELAVSTAPFADAARLVFGPWAGGVVAAGAAISCLGALNGLVFLLGQMPFVFARDGLLPAGFSRLSPGGTPVRALVLSGVLVTLFLAFNYADSLVNVFTFIILISTLSVLLPFALSALSEIKFRWTERASMSSRAWIRSLIVPVCALAYSIWAVTGAGRDTMLWGMLLYVAGIPIYVWMKRKYGSQKVYPNPLNGGGGRKTMS